jgi:regulator of sigma E protease
MMMHYGDQYLPMESVKYGIQADSVAQSIGLRDGDKIISIDGRSIERFNEIPLEIILGEGGQISLIRNGEEKTINISEEQKGQIIAAKTQLVEPRVPFIVDDFSKESAARAAGMKKGDSLVGLNGEPISTFNEFVKKLPQHAGEEVSVMVMRGGEQIDISMELPETGLMGVSPRTDFLEFKTQKYGFFEAFPAGLDKAVTVLGDYIRQFKLIFNPETQAYKEVGGFLTIADQFDTQWNWERFWAFTAFLSIMLAFLNILPIPALDGGHVVFVLWEMITGRKPSEKVLEYAQLVGFIILMGLILVVNGNDILKLLS